MSLRTKVKHYKSFTAFLVSIVISYPLFADDTTIGDLNARIDDLERQINEGGGKTDDVNPGTRVTMEDLDRIKEEVRAVRGRSEDMNSLQDELRLMRDDIKQLKKENAELRAQKASKIETLPSDSRDEKPAEKMKSGSLKSKTPLPAESVSVDLDEETASVIQLLEKSAPGADQDDTEAMPTKKQKKNVEVEAVRDAATKQAEETAPKLPTGNAEAQYNEAFALHDKGEYKNAERAFSDFIESYPNDPLVSKAMYWKAESCLQQKNYKDAKILLVNAYKKNPKGPKAPDCLLRLGEILAIQGKNADACTAWRKLKKDFPHMTAEMKTELTTLKKTYGCQVKSEDAPKSAAAS
jgi:tol-pal system protein YbgF